MGREPVNIFDAYPAENEKRKKADKIFREVAFETKQRFPALKQGHSHLFQKPSDSI